MPPEGNGEVVSATDVDNVRLCFRDINISLVMICVLIPFWDKYFISSSINETRICFLNIDIYIDV